MGKRITELKLLQAIQPDDQILLVNNGETCRVAISFSIDNNNNVNFSGLVNGRDLSVDGVKLDNIEAGATADQTGPEIKALYEAQSNSNAFTDAEKSKLGNIEAGATADQTGAEIKALYEAELDTNAYTDSEKTKLAGIETGATADQVWGEIGGTLANQTDLQGALDAKLANVSEDTTPQLGGNLDVNGQSLVSTSNGDIPITPNGTGKTKITNLHAPMPINNQTGTAYTLVLSDAFTHVTMNNAGANTLTIPANASVAFPIGTQILISQLGAGATTVAITTDTLNVNATFTLTLAGQYSQAIITKITSTSWLICGDLGLA